MTNNALKLKLEAMLLEMILRRQRGMSWEELKRECN